MGKRAFAPERDPALRFSNELSRSTNMRGMGVSSRGPISLELPDCDCAVAMKQARIADGLECGLLRGPFG
jgi:hypothetical protein